MFHVNSTKGRASRKVSVISLPSRPGKTVAKPEPMLWTTMSWGKDSGNTVSYEVEQNSVSNQHHARQWEKGRGRERKGEQEREGKG